MAERRVRWAVGAAALVAAGCAPAGALHPGATPEPPAGRRAILVSFDSFSEQRLRETLPAGAVPSLLQLVNGGSCAAYVVPAFPSKTAPGHAALWTGAYGSTSGIADNLQPRLPWGEHTLLELGSGYSAEWLRAEPLWVTAAAAGVRVAGHHTTQAPRPPGYPAAETPAEPALLRARERAERIMAGPEAAVLNGYNRILVEPAAITERQAPPRAASRWAGVEGVDLGRLPPREIAWAAAGDSLFALLVGDTAYSAMIVAPARDARLGVRVAAAPADTTSPAGRPLARFFSDPLALSAGGEPVWIPFRLFHLARDGSRFLLFHPGAAEVEATSAALGDAYLRSIGGWVGNGPHRLLERGALGVPLAGGGAGEAEARYLDALEWVTRQFMRGSEWLWRTHRPALQLDYFPLADEVDHDYLGLADPAVPGFDPVLAARAQRVRARAWALVDLRLAHLRSLVEAEPDAALFVSGDHGMRSTWRVFRPNAALREAGLLTLGPEGGIDLSRTRAISPGGTWVQVNHTRWRGGIVPPDSAAAVLAAAERALLAARGDDGQPVVTSLWRPGELAGLGLGGAVGGELYFGTAPGYRWSRDARGPVAGPGAVQADHGFPSLDADMLTVFCGLGSGLRPGRFPGIRLVDVAPTVAEWVGIPPPAQATGRSVLQMMTRP